MAERLRFFAPDNVAAELAAAQCPDRSRPLTPAGGRCTGGPRCCPASRAAIHDQPGPLTGPLAATPATFLHGDWKMGNLGSPPRRADHPARLGLSRFWPACWDLCWYLALNRARLPESKEAAISRFRQALEAAASDTSGWFERQLDLCLIAIMATFGWEKALGDEGELAWWEDKVADGRRPAGTAPPGRGRVTADHYAGSQPVAGRRGATLVYGPDRCRAWPR